MPLRRSIAWSTAMRDLHAGRDAVRPAAAIINDRFMQQAAAKAALSAASALPLVVEGQFNRSAIMERARGSSLAWSALLSSALKFAWVRAKMARKAQVH